MKKIIRFLAHSLLAFPWLCGAFGTVVEAESKRSSTQFSSDDYENLVEDAVRKLVRKDSEGFKKLLSPTMLGRSEKQLGSKAIEKIINERFIPFFSDFNHLEPNGTITKTKDVEGHEGSALYRYFLNEQKTERPFVFYILEEDGKLVVGNLLINKTMRDTSLAEQGR